MKRVLITGASGLIGSALSKFLYKNNIEVVKLSRSKKKDSKNNFTWDIESGFIEKKALENTDHIIHLAGAGIGDKRWTPNRKKEIINSRVKSAELLYNEISKLDKKPVTFISASAVGYYGAKTLDTIFTEKDPPANDFQGNVCSLWEESSKQFDNLGIRTVQLRFGVVLSPNNGALRKMSIPIKFGIGSPYGNGRQYIPWIHIYDVINLILFCMNNEKIKGVYNSVSPSYVTNEKFLKLIAKVLNRPFIMPNIPAFLLKIILGRMSEVVLEGSRISSDKIIDAGYEFRSTELETALSDLLGK